ncbi:putative nucleoside-diphosphate-sugar epimerase [Kangiella sediminilitoris]|uniref:Putative nucleoside-diphosphate-sugar epimerase n=2 Tax=Kangiella sediminilitoris TaxID=1144748 RepID=A0A1B3B7N1_9GAMM|nr:putative nucleoside-diphosphate-sugar epimerase [Kangiella sediminilitoris]
MAITLGLTLMISKDVQGAGSERELMITDFSPQTESFEWYVQNDNVMGGRSKGGFELKKNLMVFSGSTNTNGGGFSSVITRSIDADLSEYDGVRIKVKADGRRYIWQLQSNARWRGYIVNYWAYFDTKDGEWMEVDIPFEQFYPQIRGFKLSGPNINPAEIKGMGLYIYDKKDGPFELHLDSVKAYSVN